MKKTSSFTLSSINLSILNTLQAREDRNENRNKNRNVNNNKKRRRPDQVLLEY